MTDIGKLLLRIAIGGLMLFHGISKIRSGVGMIEKSLVDLGMPGFFAYGVYVGEVIAPALVLIGWQTRLAALVMAFNMVVAIFIGHRHEIFVLNHGAPVIELALMYLLGSLAIALIGSGHYALQGGRGRFD